MSDLISSSIDAALFKKLLRDQFPIGEVLELSLFAAGSRPAEANNETISLRTSGATIFLLSTADGRYALKVFAATQPLSQCMIEPNLASWLESNDFPQAPVVISTKSGAPLGVVEQRNVLLLRFVPCTRQFTWSNPSWTLSDCNEAGMTLARLHNKLAILSSETVIDWGLSSELQPSTLGIGGQVGVSSIRPYLTEWLLKAFELLRSGIHNLEKTLAQLVLSKEESVLTLCADAEKCIAQRSSAAKKIFVHGDFHPGNLLWQDNEVKTIVDFENAHYEHPVYDLAYSILMFSCNWQAVPEKQPFSTEYATAMIKRYLSCSEATNKNECRDLLGAYLRLNGALIILWLLHDCMSTNRFDQQLRYLLENLSELRTWSDRLAL